MRAACSVFAQVQRCLVVPRPCRIRSPPHSIESKPRSAQSEINGLPHSRRRTLGTRRAAHMQIPCQENNTLFGTAIAELPGLRRDRSRLALPDFASARAAFIRLMGNPALASQNREPATRCNSRAKQSIILLARNLRLGSTPRAQSSPSAMGEPL